ncbi:hypothetical protein ACJWDR_37405 [Streptomyces tauricus]|uniref:hypothetical protein n=1 Tax=Streptomyces tauricus TaxID=68274 RepID=UPI00387EF1B5
MSEQHDDLTDMQRSRIDFARRDLEAARSEDLAQLPHAGLIIQITHLIGRLDDLLHLVDEISGPTPRLPESNQ